MSLADIFIVGVGVAVIVFSLTLTRKYSDPDERIKLHEDMGVVFALGTSREEKLKFLDQRGLIPASIKRPVLLAVVVIVFCIGYFYFNGLL
jgi:hypothetical protein